jgi:hypothetical protein
MVSIAMVGVLLAACGPQPPEEIELPLRASAVLARSANDDCYRTDCLITYRLEIVRDVDAGGFYTYECDVAALDDRGRVVYRGTGGGSDFLGGGGRRQLRSFNLAVPRVSPALRHSITDLEATCRTTTRMEEPEAAPTPNISVTGVADVTCPPGVASDRHCFEYTFENRGGHGTTTCSFRRSIHVKAHMFGDHRFMDHD